jgi:hypothetical protein
MAFLTTQLLELYCESDCEELLPFLLERIAQEKQHAIETSLVLTARLALNNYSEAQVKELFRFQKYDIPVSPRHCEFPLW